MKRDGIGESLRLILFLAIFVSSGLIAVHGRAATNGTEVMRDSPVWLYRRDGWSHSVNGDGMEILMVGDIMPGRNAQQEVGPFRYVSKEIARADLAVGNLEGVILSETLQKICLNRAHLNPEYRLLLSVETAAQLQQAGFDILGLANNHILDCGNVGAGRSVSILKNAGLETIGIGMSRTEAYQPFFINLRGTRIAFLAFSAIFAHENTEADTDARAEWQPAIWEPVRALEAVRLAKSQADFVIVSMHWGSEYKLEADLYQRYLAEGLISAGADVVFGHHPHVIQETEVIWRGETEKTQGFAAYSLGNFTFDQFGTYTSQGLALRIFIDRQGLQAVEALPLHASLQPRWMRQADSTEILPRIRPEPSWLGFICGGETCVTTNIKSTTRGGIFTSGAVDLTGDGRVERVWLNDGQIFIYRLEELIWKSPIDWDVIDLALGDPNDDGRYEIMAAVNRNKNSEPTSQPFILGYRSGMVRQLWGGSPVSDPIREIELGDIDSDGRQELVVIEERGDENRAVAAWKWHGWGFSLFWRSLENRYVDLVIDTAPQNPAVITVGLEW